MEPEDEPLEIDLKHALTSYLPVLFEFFAVQDFTPQQWDKLNGNFLERYLKRKAEWVANDHHLEVSPNIHDLISAKLKGNVAASRYLDFIKKTLEELSENLSDSEKKAINKTLYDFLISYDYRFKNYLGELLVLNSLLKSKLYTLEKVEAHIVNNQTADFLFSKKNGAGQELIEVVSLHIDDSHTMLESYLPRSFSRKISKKTGGGMTHPKFTLIPVIWGAPVDLIRVLDAWRLLDKKEFACVFEPVSYICLSSAKNQDIYKFGTLSTLLKEINAKAVG